MPRFPLSLALPYRPDWAAYEATREAVSNGRDAEIMLNAPLTISWHNQTLRIENEGCTLPREAILLGTTTKTGRSDTIGTWGEGIALSALAATRAGRMMKIRTGSEVWSFTIGRHDTLKADVLILEIKDGNEFKNRVRVEIGGVTEAEWREWKERFLFLQKLKPVECIETDRGRLLLGDKWKGKLFVKGVYVEYKATYQYGYDLLHAKLDPERKIVQEFDRDWEIKEIWRQALAKDPDFTVGRFQDMLKQETPTDLRGLSDWGISELPTKAVDQVVDAFKKAHGEDAIPVANIAEARDLEHLGKRGVVCPKTERLVIEQRLGKLEDVKKNLAQEVGQKHQLHDFSPEERANLEGAVTLLNEAGVPTDLGLIDIVDFRDPKLQGMWKGGRWLLARKLLSDQVKTLSVLIHERAHDHGADGDVGHVRSEEEAWEGVVRYLLKRG